MKRLQFMKQLLSSRTGLQIQGSEKRLTPTINCPSALWFVDERAFTGLTLGRPTALTSIFSREERASINPQRSLSRYAS
ncbi:hypothetical protein RRG08_042547 [Elysia crispata]|uniref:Uncharacterized protein n=1 Tax=Elysia crispata TaxID=231223 RepID=A0AAE0XPT8_9GAST|nr:hypothetical protein RRG08_042547 [Elysia crispata]